MHGIRWMAFVLAAAVAATLQAASLPALHARCSIGPSDQPGQFSLRVYDEDCDEGRHCSTNFNHDPFSRLTGITRADLARDGENLTATMNAEAGTFVCAGTVHEGILTGTSTFTPDQTFVDRMERMGFTGFNTEKLEAYAFVGVESAAVQSLQQAGVKGLTTDNIIALRIFNVDRAYVSSLSDLGYATPDADKLIALRVQHVDPAEVRKIRALGLQPTLDELIQIGVFHITPDFVRRMQARGLKDLSVAKLVQIKIFKLEE